MGASLFDFPAPLAPAPAFGQRLPRSRVRVSRRTRSYREGWALELDTERAAVAVQRGWAVPA